MTTPNQTPERPAVEADDHWNVCPACGVAIDVDDCFDGSEYECGACDLTVVATSFTDGSWRLCPMDSGAGKLIAHRDRLQQQLADAMPVVEAAEAWRDWWTQIPPGALTSALYHAIDTYRNGNPQPTSDSGDAYDECEHGYHRADCATCVGGVVVTTSDSADGEPRCGGCAEWPSNKLQWYCDHLKSITSNHSPACDTYQPKQPEPAAEVGELYIGIDAHSKVMRAAAEAVSGEDLKGGDHAKRVSPAAQANADCTSAEAGAVEAGPLAKACLRVAQECVEIGYTSGRIAERLREKGVSVTQSDLYPFALAFANTCETNRDYEKTLCRERDEAKAALAAEVSQRILHEQGYEDELTRCNRALERVTHLETEVAAEQKRHAETREQVAKLEAIVLDNSRDWDRLIAERDTALADVERLRGALDNRTEQLGETGDELALELRSARTLRHQHKTDVERLTAERDEARALADGALDAQEEAEARLFKLQAELEASRGAVLYHTALQLKVDNALLEAKLAELQAQPAEVPECAALVVSEFERANGVHAPMNSAHEGYAVILEELDELWEEVRKGGTEPRDLGRMRKEAVQTGAMCLRFLHNVCGVTGLATAPPAHIAAATAGDVEVLRAVDVGLW